MDSDLLTLMKSVIFCSRDTDTHVKWGEGARAKCKLVKITPAKTAFIHEGNAKACK